LKPIVQRSLSAASAPALAVGLALVTTPTLLAQNPVALASAGDPWKASGNRELSLVRAAANDAPSAAKQATPKDPRVWAPLIHQTYPREAAIAGLEGSVRIRVVVDKKGRVSDCFVLQTSGHRILDQAACDGMRRFAMFSPAIDASGSPTVGSYATVITYKMRAQQPPPRPPISPDSSAPTT